MAIETACSDHVFTLRFARPEKKNALTTPMYQQAAAALRAANADSAVHVILLEGAGEDFCAGNDIADFLRDGAVAAATAVDFIHALVDNARPMVAAVKGVAVGIGATMLLHCDHVVAADNARFRFPFVDLGLVPEAGSSWLLQRRVGEAKAAEWVMMSAPFDAAEARQHGLVNAVMPRAALDEAAREAARRLAAKPPAALMATRRLMRGDLAPLRAAIVEESKAFQIAVESPEARAVFAAFMSGGRV